MMNRKMILFAGSCLVSLGLMTGAVSALSTFLWTGDCPCSGRSPGSFTCTGDWDTSSNWDLPGYPDGTGDQALIRHSNHGCCGNDDACSTKWPDCCRKPMPCSCDDQEDSLEISLITETIHSLRVETENVGGTFSDKLTLDLVPESGVVTLTVGWVELDADNGKLTLTVKSNVTLKTDTSD